MGMEPFAGGRTPRSGSRPRKVASRPEAGVPRWFYVLIGLVGLLGVVTVTTIVMLGRRPKEVTADAKEPSGSARANVTPAGSAPPPASAKSSPVEQLSVIVHKRGQETPELRALLDMQGKLASSCRDDPSTCGRGWTPLARDALTPVELKDFAVSTPAGPLPAWLQRLKLPRDLPVRDELALRASFEFDTKNISGRQGLQAKLFECSAYADIFDSTFIKYGAPAWLTAVVYQESACNPRATSPVGAKGLWQFMPESARAYGLRVVEGDVDERLNPIKSTDAAVHFLTDMQRKLGAWDLTLAGYNMGPFGIVARLAQVGENAGYWDLVHAHILPEETAGYVPAIEAYALVLDNISRLQFSRDGKRLEATAEIAVKPGTRLSLVARTAATTTIHIRELNPEFLRDVVPEGETTVRVPDAEAHRAQAFLEAWTPDDNRDTCVPEDFDWGAKQFEKSVYAKSCTQTGSPR